MSKKQKAEKDFASQCPVWGWFFASSGYTLIELLVVIAIMGVLMLIGSNIFVSILRSNTKTLALNQVREQGNKAIELLSTSIDNSSGLVKPATNAQDGNCLTEIIIKNKTKDPTYANIVGNNAFTRFVLTPETSSVNGYISINNSTDSTLLDSVNSANPSYIQPSTGKVSGDTGLSAVSLRSDAYPSPYAPCFIVKHATSGNTIVVSVQFTLKQSVNAPAGRQEYVGDTRFQTYLTIRNY